MADHTPEASLTSSDHIHDRIGGLEKMRKRIINRRVDADKLEDATMEWLSH